MKNTTEAVPFNVEKVQEQLKQVKNLSDLTGANGVIQEMVKGTVERILRAEQEAHLGYAPHEQAPADRPNRRNGTSKKRLRTSNGAVDIAVPRDRTGEFEPQFIKKHQSFDPDLEQRVISMYARGMSTRDIAEQLREFYGTEVSAALISKITDTVLDGVEAWQQRALQDVYPVVFLDAIHYKIRHEGKITTKAAYTCLGIDLEGHVDVLGLWIGEHEGAHFWQTVLADLQARGVKDILIACVDGLKGFPEAIATTFPKTEIQLCIVHQIRTSLRYLASKHYKSFTQDLKAIYKASTLEVAEQALQALEEKWGNTAAASVQAWKNNWTHLSTFFQFPQEIRTMIYTTNAVEALHRQFRKVTKTKGSFPTDTALKKLLYLATVGLKGSFRRKRHWPVMLGQLKIVFGDRIPDVIV